MKTEDALLAYVKRLGDNALVLGQRLTELVAAEPELEEELANANFALDYIGQARVLYSYAAELDGEGRDEDAIAFSRDSHEFTNLLLLEQPNGHFGDTIVRQVLFEVFYVKQLEALTRCADTRLAEIAARAVKEIRYHLRHGSQWLVRLGDGTELSHERVQGSLDRLWRYCGEMFAGDAVDDVVRDELSGPDLDAIRVEWQADVDALLEEATLQKPEEPWTEWQGRNGIHTEHLGYLVAEMQFLQRAYPGATW